MARNKHGRGNGFGRSEHPTLNQQFSSLMTEIFAGHVLELLSQLHLTFIMRYASAYRMRIMNSFGVHMRQTLQSYAEQLKSIVADSVRREHELTLDKAKKKDEPKISGNSEALPHNTRFVFRAGAETVYVMEQAPRVATMNYKRELKELSFPFVVFFVHLGGDGKFRNLRVFFRQRALTTSDDMLCQTHLPNVDVSNVGRVCLTSTVQSINLVTPAEYAQEVIAHFWGSEFNMDWRTDCPLKLTNWAEMTKLDSHFATTKFPWSAKQEHTVATIAIEMLQPATNTAEPQSPEPKRFTADVNRLADQILLNWAENGPTPDPDPELFLARPFAAEAEKIIGSQKPVILDHFRVRFKF